MRSLALGAAATAATIVWAVGVQAADLAYPPSVGPPQYGLAPPPAAPPQVVIVPGAAAPRYGAPVPSAVVGPSRYGVAPPVAPPVAAPGTALPPRLACAPEWRCGYEGCGWQPSCAPRPELYSGPYGPPGPQFYSGPEGPPVPEPYAGRYAPQVYSDSADVYAEDQTYGNPYRPYR